MSDRTPSDRVLDLSQGSATTDVLQEWQLSQGDTLSQARAREQQERQAEEERSRRRLQTDQAGREAIAAMDRTIAEATAERESAARAITGAAGHAAATPAASATPSAPTAAAAPSVQASAEPPFSLSQASSFVAQPQQSRGAQLARGSSGGALWSSPAAAAAASSSSSSPMASPAASVVSSSVATASSATDATSSTRGPPSLSKLIFDGALEAAAGEEQVITVHGSVREVQTIRRRQTKTFFKCPDKQCALVITWPLTNSDTPHCRVCHKSMRLMEEELHVPTEDTTVLTQLILLSTPHYSMNPKAQADAENAAAAAAELEETGASPLMAASSPGGASVVSASSSSSSVIAASSSAVNLEAQATMPQPHIIEAQLLGSQCGEFDVGDEVEVQGRLCIRPLKGDKRLMLFIRVERIRARSLADRPVSSKIYAELQQNPLLLPMLISGFAPSVLGNKLSKLGCLLSLVSPERTVSVDDPLPEDRRNLHAIMVGRDEDVVPMLKACAMASPNGYIESLTARNSTPQAASRFIVEPLHCTEAAWDKAVAGAFTMISEQEADAGGSGARISDLNRGVVGVRGTGTVEYAQTQLGLHKRGIIAFHANSNLRSNTNAHWMNAFNKYPELHTLMRTGLIYQVSGLCAVQRPTHTPTAIIMGGSARKEAAYDDSQSFRGNVGLESNLFDEFDLQLRLDDKLPDELQASYVEQCTSPSPLISPRSSASVSSASSHASPASSPSGGSLSDRNLRMQLHLPEGAEGLPPSVLALYIRACLQVPEPVPLRLDEKYSLVEQFLTLKRQGAPLLPHSWKSMLRTMRAMARLRMSPNVTPRHVQDAFEFLKRTRADFQTEPTVQFQSTGAAGGSAKGKTLAAMRQNFLNAMYAHCQRERSWVHPVATCWDVAVSVGINRVIGPEAFAQQFLAPMMEKQMILQGAQGKYKFDRNLGP